MKATVPDKIYFSQTEDGRQYFTPAIPFEREFVKYVPVDAFIEKAKEAFCKATCNGHPPRSTCTSLGTCKEHDNFVKFMKGE